MTPTELELAYLAGIIDGEGSIMLIHHPPRASSRHRWEYWILRVAIANTDMRIIDWVIARFGGGYSVCRNGRPNQKDAYQWRLDSKRAEPILRAVAPYLLLKRRQAELAMEMISTYKLVGCNGHNLATIETRRRICAELKELNRRGKPAQASA